LILVILFYLLFAYTFSRIRIQARSKKNADSVNPLILNSERVLKVNDAARLKFDTFIA
jgi:hypothetical protein